MINKPRFNALLLGAASLAVLGACGKEAVQDISSPTTGAYVLFFNYGVTSPSVNFFANTQKLSATSTGRCYGLLPSDTVGLRLCPTTGLESPIGTGYNSAANGGLYSELPAGQYTFAGENADTTSGVHGAVISSVSTAITDSKHYSYYQTGVYSATTKTADAFVVEDDIPAITDYSVAYVRLVNAMPGSSPMTLIGTNEDSTKAVVTINSSVAYKAAGTFTSVKAGVYDLTTSGGGVANPSLTAVSFVGGHVYSVAARGDYTSSVTANKPGLSSTANR